MKRPEPLPRWMNIGALIICLSNLLIGMFDDGWFCALGWILAASVFFEDMVCDDANKRQ